MKTNMQNNILSEIPASNNDVSDHISLDQAILMRDVSDSSEALLNTVENEKNKFYNLPRYYDLAFERNIERDIVFFQKCFQMYCDGDVKRILEVACGTGMFLEYLPHYGYQTVGFDLSEAMVMYTKKRLHLAGLNKHQAKVVLGDMKDKVFKKKFDAAFVCVNSLGYLTRDADICDHFKTMVKNLRKGGIYIVEISCKCENLLNEKRVDETWHVSKEHIDLQLKWRPFLYDLKHRLRFIDFEMQVNDDQMIIEIKEVHKLRLWLFEEFKQFTSSNGFTIVGIYNQNYEEISLSMPITGELGVLFFVLKND
ncbi:MAG: putative Methyltransferase type 12 [Promethearchaeota archaeon]|nr:MAG: putative Methyltransferase type 12 [Candidatus Lokiarchaeota archaeon]